MSDYTATVIKTGNSIALRVPKRYAEDAKLVLGEKVKLSLPRKQTAQDHSKIRLLISNLKTAKAFREISDPASWQRQIRQDRRVNGKN